MSTRFFFSSLGATFLSAFCVLNAFAAPASAQNFPMGGPSESASSRQMRLAQSTGGRMEKTATGSTLVLDNFENGVGSWTRNDKVKTDNPATGVLLVDIVPTSIAPGSGGAPGSANAALISFKSAKSSWASASLRVSGAQWAQIGAQRLNFWLNAGGDEKGIDLVLRANYKGEDGVAREESFVVPVRLDSRNWRRVVIPLADVKNANGPLLPRLSGVYLLQFVQRGTWDSRFFTVDDLTVEGTGVPLNQARDAQSLGGGSAGTTGENTSNTSTQTAVGAPVQINVDFLKKQGRIRTAANVSIGATLPGAVGTLTYPLGNNADFRTALSVLRPRFVRLDAAGLSTLTNSRQPSFDFSRLADAVKRVRALGAEPLLSLTNDPAWGLDSRRYAVYAKAAANAVNQNNARPVRWFEVAPGTTDATAAIAFYNRAQTAIKALSPANRVGGMGASSGNTGLLRALMSGARGLDFLSVSFYGASSGLPSEATLFASARGVQNLKSAAGVLDASRFRNVPLFVSRANMNAARESGANAPQDSRVMGAPGGAWWAAFLGSGSRLSDQIFHNDAVNPEWGLIDEKAKVYPAYYVMWMWNNYLPVGSERVLATALRSDKPTNDVVVTAVNAPVVKGRPIAHNVLLANTRDQSVAVKIAIRGFPVLRAAQMQIMDDPLTVRQDVALPKSPFQTITLRPHSVAVVQFLEPPK